MAKVQSATGVFSNLKQKSVNDESINSGKLLVASHRHEHVVAAVEEVGQGLLETREVEVLTEDPVAETVPEAAVGVVVGVLAELDDVVTAEHLDLELLPVDLGLLGGQLRIGAHYCLRPSAKD